MRKNYLMKSVSIILMLLAMMFSCQPVSEDVDSGNSNSNNTSQGGNNDGDNNEEDKPANPQTLTLQQIINDTNAGEEIDLSKYKDVTNYTATVNKALTIKNGSLNNAKLIVTAENVKLEKLEKVSVTASSRLTINNSKLSDLLIGTSGETSRSGTLSTEMSLAMVSVAGCEIGNVGLNGFNSQLNIVDVKTKISDIITSTKAKIILEAGRYAGMKDPTVTDDGELTRIDMTKEKELSVLSIYSNPKKVEYQIGEELDVSGLVVMGTYTSSIEIFKSGGWKGEAVDSVTKWEDEKDYTVTCEDFSTAGVKIVTITSNIDAKVKCNFYVYVKDAQNTEIKEPEITQITGKPLGTPKTLYRVGEKLDLSWVQVVGIYNDLEINLEYTSEPANGTTLTTVGETTVTLYYNDEKIAEFPITVEKTFLVEFYDGIDNSKPLYTQKVANGEKPSRPFDPVREDYKFTGWYYDDVCSKPATYVFSESAEKDIQLYAGWVKNVYVHDITIKVINLPTEVKALSIWCSFNEWELENIMADEDVYIADVINGTAEFYFEKIDTIYPLWCQFVPMTSRNMTMSNITWWKTAFSGSPYWDETENNLVYDGTLANKTTLTLNVKAVYGDVSGVFEERFNTEDYMNAFQVSVGECKYKIFYEGFDVEEDTYNNNMTSFDDDYDVVLSNPSRYGYTFAGWYETSDFSGKPITGWKAGEKKADVTLYAKWEECTYKITYNGITEDTVNSNVTSFEITHDVVLKNPSRPGYSFLGWYETADFSGYGITGWYAGEKTADVILYARWGENTPIYGGTGVYSYKLNLDEISGAWGESTTSPEFSVVLLTDEQLADCKAAEDFYQATAAEPEYQISGYANMKIADTSLAGNYAVYGSYAPDNEYKYYDGVAVTVTENTFELFVDMSKITKTQLRANWEGNNQQLMTEDDIVDLTGYKPYVIALGQEQFDSDNYVFTAWSADVMKMTLATSFPTDLQYAAPKVLTYYDLKYIAGNATIDEITGAWNHVALDENNSYDFTYTLYGTDKYGEDVYDAFKFTSGTWDFQAGGIQISALDTEFELYSGNTLGNIIFSNGLLTVGKEYTISLIVRGENEAYVKITPKGANYDEPTSVSATAENVASIITGLSAGAYKLTVTGTMDSDILEAVKTAMQSKKDVEIALDLGGTTGLTEIPDSAFSGCNLTSIVIPEGVTSIGEYALSCLSDSVTIPSTVTSIGYEAFGGEYGDLKAVYISDLVAWCGISIGGSVGSCGSPFFNGAKLYLDGELVTDLVIPDEVTSIKSQAFYGYTYLKSVTIPDSVTSIGWWAFCKCDNLESVSFGNGITTIGNGAFGNCSSLKNIAIPDNIVSIGQAFDGCDNLEYNEYDNGLYLGNTDKPYLVLMQLKNQDITSCEIADTTKIIVDCVFQQCMNLESIAIPDSVTTIGDSAFYYCNSLTSVTIPDSVTTIGYCAFGSCENLASVTFADTNDWYYTSDSNYTDGTAVDVTDTAQNATYLTSTYNEKYWYKQ